MFKVVSLVLAGDTYVSDYLHELKYLFLGAALLQEEAVWIRALQHAARLQQLTHAVLNEACVRRSAFTCSPIDKIYITVRSGLMYSDQNKAKLRLSGSIHILAIPTNTLFLKMTCS